MTNDQQPLDEFAVSVYQQLLSMSARLVLAESCTGGLIAATLARIPGASVVLAGSAVVYQLQTKTEWLQIEASLLENPGPVSREVAERMAVQVLKHTPHATVSLSVTGHLGPDAPPDLDGVVWSAVAFRDGRVSARKLRLSGTLLCDSPSGLPSLPRAVLLRRQRQSQAVRLALQFLMEQVACGSE